MTMDLSKLNWQFYYEKNDRVAAEKFLPLSIGNFSDKKTFKAVVPSCLEYLLYMNGETEDPAFSDNIFSLRKF